MSHSVECILGVVLHVTRAGFVCYEFMVAAHTTLPRQGSSPVRCHFE
jgi:hypothetical protein